MAIDAPGVLVDTKFNPPVLGALVERRRLVEVLAGSTQPVKLVRAPAGWGKSTLVAAWSASPNEVRPFAWLALDTADDEPRRFWMYVIEGLRRLDPSVGTGSMRLLSAPGTDMRDHVLSQLLNEVAAMPEPAVLAIDDYHQIAGREIHSQLAFFVEHLPPTLQVSLTSRSEPPLPLPRWRARGELLEIDAVQLRFERGEAGELLNDVLGLELPSAQVARLNQRTEGWAAGLYLAALSLRGADDRRHFVERFAGDDRNVVDYLAAEVLAAQPARIREALVRTSILDRLCESLVEAVAGVEEGSTLLREIEAAGLFLVPLDSKRQWYRYHHLFQQLLRLELANAEPEIVVDLHGRAAAWHLEAGSVPEAIEHTLAAGDRPTAIELIAQHWAPTLLAAAGDSLVDTWLSALGDEAVAGDFRLCFARCFIALSLGDMGVVARWLEIAKDAPVGGPLYEGLSSKAGGIACIQAAFLWESGEAGRAREAGREVLSEEAESSPWRGIGAATIGLGSGAYGEWEDGSRWMREYARLGRSFGQHLNEESGLGSAAVFEAELGNWSGAEELAERSTEIAARHGIDEHWSAAHGHLGLALVLEHRDELDAARRRADRAATLARRGYGPVSTGNVLIHLARIEAGCGDHEAARATLEEAEATLVEAADAGILQDRLARTRNQVGMGRRAAAPGAPLTDRELDVLRLLATELSQREIGDALYVSLNTVKSHAKSIFHKLEASDRADAVARARELELL